MSQKSDPPSTQHPSLVGTQQLLHGVVDLATEIVAESHDAVARSVHRAVAHVEPLAPLQEPLRHLDAVRHGVTGAILAGVRLVNHTVQATADVALQAVLAGLPEVAQKADPGPVPQRSDRLDDPAVWRDAWLGMVNGAIGDLLVERNNPLAMPFALRLADAYLDEEPLPLQPGMTDRIVVFVHGLCTTEWAWSLDAHKALGDPAAQYGSVLQREAGLTPIFVRYNSGLPIAVNAAHLARRLERLTQQWPMALNGIVLIGHSMGGLIARQACQMAAENGHGWLARTDDVFCLGTPHRGAGLEQVADVVTETLGAVDWPATLIPARLLAMRSAGIQDLRQGLAVPLLPGIRWHFYAATVGEHADSRLTALLGDMMVSLKSALGPEGELQDFEVATEVFSGVTHAHLQCDAQICERLVQVLGPLEPL